MHIEMDRVKAASYLKKSASKTEALKDAEDGKDADVMP